MNETLPDLAGWLVDGETGEGLHNAASVHLHLIHGSSTLDGTTTFGHYLREKLLCGNIAFCACVGSVRSSSPKYASHGLWKPSPAITAKAPIPSLSAWKECLMSGAHDQHTSGTHGKTVVGPSIVSRSCQLTELLNKAVETDSFQTVVDDDTNIDCRRRQRHTIAAPCCSFSGVEPFHEFVHSERL